MLLERWCNNVDLILIELFSCRCMLFICSGINMGRAGSGSELESVTYGSTGTDQSIPIVETLSNTAAGCTMHVATFSILCRTPPGIAGPHYWKITVAGQATQEMVKTEYSRPQDRKSTV